MEADKAAHRPRVCEFGRKGKSVTEQELSDRARELADPSARELGHEWLGALHILLGLTRSDGPAADVLAQEGVVSERIVSVARDLIPAVGADPEGGAFGPGAFNPVAWRSIARAEGFLSGGSDFSPDEALLLAILWDRDTFTAALFRKLGVPRRSLAAAIRVRHGGAPSGDPPADRPRPLELSLGDPLLPEVESFLARHRKN